MTLTTETKITSTIDWYSYTCDHPIYSLKSTMVGTSLDKGLMGYTVGVRFIDKRLELINPDRPDMRVHVVYSGEALKIGATEFQTSPLEVVLMVARNESIARIDIAIDIKNGSLDIGEMSQIVDAGKHVTRAKKSYYFKTLQDTGETLYIGAPTSKVRLRIYDKAAEQNMTDFDWTRIELQIRGKKAHTVKNMIKESKSLAPIPLIIKGFCDFPTHRDFEIVVGRKAIPIASPEKADTNTRQWLLNSVARTLGREIALDYTNTLKTEFDKTVAEEKRRVEAQIQRYSRNDPLAPD